MARSWTLLSGVWLALLGASAALSVLAAREDRLPGDLAITREVQGWPFPGETLSDFVRAATATDAVILAGLALAVLLWATGQRRPALTLALGVLILPLLQSGIKELVDRPRPAPGVVELRASFSSPSFPAGHVMSPTVLYGFVLYLCAWLPWPAALRILGAAWAAFLLGLTGLVNIHLGVHWPSDVLGGYAWGLVLLLPLLALTGVRRPERNGR